MPLLKYFDHQPKLAPDVFVAPDAHVIGMVTIGPRSSIWFGATVRGDTEPITIGEGCNVQDHCTLHTDEQVPLTIGNYVSLGHNAIVHSATIEDQVLIAISASVLTGARIGAGSIVGANALVPEGREFPPRSLIVGTPARVLREVTDAEYHRILQTSTDYMRLAQQFIQNGYNSREYLPQRRG
jgi:carbonic anhydrase/acetyltransferase-like protein (isoleucine patch superfamily)